MRRKFYFFLDRLQISRGERNILAILGICLILLTLLNLVTEQKPVADPEHYRELETIFEERSRLAGRERKEILARYSGRATGNAPEVVAEPSVTAGRPVMAPADTLLPGEGAVRDTTIDINRAGREELQMLPGIGPVYADRIVEWRERYGNFQELNQLLEIRGIGEKRLENLAPYIRLETPPGEIE